MCLPFAKKYIHINVMNTQSESCSDGESITKERTATEAAIYIAGVMTAAAQMIMPIRMWITLITSTIFVIKVSQSDSTIDVVKILCIYIALITTLIASAIFSKQTRKM